MKQMKKMKQSNSTKKRENLCFCKSMLRALSRLRILFLTSFSLSLLILTPNLVIAQWQKQDQEQTQAQQVSFDSCMALKTLIEQSRANFSELQRLKNLCSEQLALGSDSFIPKVLNDLNFSLALQQAQNKRIEEKMSLNQQIQKLVKPYIIKNKDSLEKLSLSYGTSETGENYFSHTVKELNKIQTQFSSLNKLSLFDYFDCQTKDKLQSLRLIPPQNLNIQTIVVLSELENQQKDFESKSQRALTELDEKIQEYINSSINIVNGFISRSIIKESEDVIRDFQESLKPSVLKLKGTLAWNRFIIKSKLEKIWILSDFDYYTGMVQSGKEKLKISDQLINDFLAKLPPSMVSHIQDLDSFKKIQENNRKRIEEFNSLSIQEIDERLKKHLNYQLEIIKTTKDQCLIKYPDFANRLNQSLLDFNNFESTNKSTNNKSSSLTIDKELQHFFKESLANRLQIFVDLCEEFSK